MQHLSRISIYPFIPIIPKLIYDLDLWPMTWESLSTWALPLSVCVLNMRTINPVFFSVTEFIPFTPKAIYIEIHKICLSSKFLNFSKNEVMIYNPPMSIFITNFMYLTLKMWSGMKISKPTKMITFSVLNFDPWLWKFINSGQKFIARWGVNKGIPLCHNISPDIYS